MMKFVLVTLLSLCVADLMARELSLSEAVLLSQEKSWDSFMANEEHEKILLQRRQVLATVLPQIGVQASYQNYLTAPEIGGFRMNSTHQVDLGLSVRQKLFEFGGIGSSLKAAAALLQQSQYRKQQLENYLRHETTLAYYAVLLSQEQLRIIEESYQNSQNNLGILRRSFATGRAPRGDILRLETDIVSRRSQVNMARTDLESAQLGLKELLKIDREQTIRLTTKLSDILPALAKDELLKTATEENLDLKVLRQGVEYLSNASKVERSQLLPKLGLFYNYSLSGRSDESAFGMDQDVNSQVIGVELTWNLWNGGGSRARYHETKKDIMIADYTLKRSEDKLLLDLNKAINEYESIRDNIETDKQSLKLAQESFSMVQDLLKVGKTSITELNSTEGLLNSIKVNYLMNLFRAHERLSLINYLTHSKGL